MAGFGRRMNLVALTLPVFAATLCLSAMLLFSVQPMFTKMVLPPLGGSPGAWSVAMVFFQAVLLLGYAYAHALTRWVDPRRAVVIHLAVFGLALFTLPLALAGGFGKPPAEYQAFWLIGLFGASIGLPFFAVAANAPMLQAWFARTSHPQAHDPYFLYGASNLGSFCALLAYPVLIEPFLTLQNQSYAWTAGFVVLMAMIAGAGLLMTATMRPSQAMSPSNAIVAKPPVWRDRLIWIALAFVPSALLIAVTSHISTDLASAPFLWVVPLALFLATFVFTFRQGGDATQYWMIRLQPFVIAPMAISLMGGARAYWLVAMALDLAMFVITTMMCHRALYLRRPESGYLTEFYMWISVGGVLGGIFSGLIAPFAFPDVWEYPILIVLALLCRPGAFLVGRRPWIKGAAVLAALIAIASVPRAVFGFELPAFTELPWTIVLIFAAAFIMLNASNPVRLTVATALVLTVTALYRPGIVRNETARSFFGVHKVVESTDGRFRMLFHGTTLHGVQRLFDEQGVAVSGKPEPLTYYYDGSPLSDSVHAAQAAKPGSKRIAVVGLGTGSLACHARPDEDWTFYEIDPAVVRIAQDATKFRFLSECLPHAGIVLGDARLTLAEAAQPFDLIVLDAFSSDAVPVHLLTSEAFGQYLDKLAPGGFIAFHISNRYLELTSVVAEVAATRGLVTFVRLDGSATDEDMRRDMRSTSLVAAVARNEHDLRSLKGFAG